MVYDTKDSLKVFLAMPQPLCAQCKRLKCAGVTVDVSTLFHVEKRC